MGSEKQAGSETLLRGPLAGYEEGEGDQDENLTVQAGKEHGPGGARTRAGPSDTARGMLRAFGKHPDARLEEPLPGSFLSVCRDESSPALKTPWCFYVDTMFF